MRLLWSQDDVTFHGKYFTLDGVTVHPKPVQAELPPIWIGGRSEFAIRRTARIGDGWLVSQATPDEVDVGVSQIKAMAEECGNEIEDDHYGALFSYCIADTYDEARRIAEPYMLRRRTDVDYDGFSAFGTADRLRDLIDAYIDAGATKFVAPPRLPAGDDDGPTPRPRRGSAHLPLLTPNPYTVNPFPLDGGRLGWGWNSRPKPVGATLVVAHPNPNR